MGISNLFFYRALPFNILSLKLCSYGSHAYLNEYIIEHKCRRILEIGVYNGENAVSMVKVALKNYPAPYVEYYGFDFYKHYTKQDVSEKLEQLGCNYRLVQGNTLETIPETVAALPEMDLIFIDGGKNYQLAQSDWNCSSMLMHHDTGVFVHNVGFSEVSRMIENIPREKYNVEVFSPRFEGQVALIKRNE